MKDYRLTNQRNIYLFFRKVVASVAPAKIENTKALTNDERKEVVRRIQKKYNLSEEQILKYLDLNIAHRDVLRMFLEVEGLDSKYEEYETKRCSKQALYHHLCYFLVPLILLTLFNAVAGLFAYQPTGYIVMGSVDLLFVPFVVFELARFWRICSFIRDKNNQISKINKLIVVDVHPVFAFETFRHTPRHERFITLLYLVLGCDIDGKKVKIWCFADDMNNSFPAGGFFPYKSAVESLSKRIKGMVISGKCFSKHNVLVGGHNIISRLVYSLCKNAN